MKTPESPGPRDWSDRLPRPGETCVFSHPYQGFADDDSRLVSLWKRDALLFDRVYARCLDAARPPDIPLELSFGIERLDQDVRQYDANTANMLAQAYAGTDPEELWAQIKAGTHEVTLDLFDFDSRLASNYVDAGVMAEWTYSAAGPYLRRFNQGEQTAYEGALNNLPIVSATDTSWDQIIAFRSDPESVRKYRDLRLWLRTGLEAQSAQHATDIIGQKIEDYRWSIKKHGFQSSIGAITQLFDWKESRLTLAAAGVAGLFGGPIWASIASGLTIAAQVCTFVVEKRIAADDVRRGHDREIAILYEAQERFAMRRSR